MLLFFSVVCILLHRHNEEGRMAETVCHLSSKKQDKINTNTPAACCATHSSICDVVLLWISHQRVCDAVVTEEGMHFVINKTNHYDKNTPL